MNQLPILGSRRLRKALLVAVIGGLAAVAVAENVVMKNDVAVLSDKNPFASTVETVVPNSTLQILSRDGGWVRVRTASGKEGFISSDDLPANTNLSKVTGSGNATGADASLASRGLESDTENYARQKNLNPRDAQLMVDWGKLITRDDVVKFAQEGHVGPARFRK
jgi:hypothetical protein